jgi:ribosomal-protein-alanine N-acetyltransferase
MTGSVRLRPFTEQDLDYLDRWGADPEAVGVFEWPGHLDPRRRRRRFEKDGYISPEHTALAVALPDGTAIGVISYWPKHHGGPAGGCYETGIALLPEHRGRGHGTTAQRLLVDYLFGYTTANRVEALTDEENVAEQRSLERAGFRREGVLRGAYFHRARWRDLVVYAVLRGDPRPAGGPPRH